MNKALVLITRDFLSQNNGRSKVISTFLNSLSCLNIYYDLVILDGVASENDYYKLSGVDQVRIVPCSIVYSLLGALSSFFNRRSFNFNFFRFTPGLGRCLDELIKNNSYDFVYSDTVRMLFWAKKTKLDIYIDLDDLYSKRYSNILESSSNVNILGYKSVHIPKLILRIINKLGIFFLARETKLLNREEVEAVKNSRWASLVSIKEALELQENSGKNVFDFPMSIDIPSFCWTAKPLKNDIELVFVGSPLLQQNYLTLLQINNLFVTDRLDGCVIYIVGECTGFDTSNYDPRIVFVGKVPDLYSYLCTKDCFFSPIFSGTGIKTKNLEAVALAMPVVTSLCGTEGTDLDKYVLIFNDINDISTDIIRNHIKSLERSKLLSGREYIIKNFSREESYMKLKKYLL